MAEQFDAKWKKYLRTQWIASFLINAVLNGLIIFFFAWGKHVYTTGALSIIITFAIDNFITCPLLGYFGSTGAVKNLKKENALFSLPANGSFANRFSGRLKKPGALGFLLGFAAFAVMLGLSSAAVLLLRIETFTKWGYVWYKAAYTGALAALFSALFHRAGLKQPIAATEK